ncbi:MAG TPA: hypothetical protein VNT53_01065 [Pseudolysinimonas sp.]|nr:hypothetical protein [Pseudolysinimonas sp.]
MSHQHNALGVLPIQLAVANASPGSWEDAFVTAVCDDMVETVSMADGRVRAFVSSAELEIGDPVGLHLVAELISAGPRRYTARAAR